jgi:ubiquitin C-terminal hydrolase
MSYSANELGAIKWYSEQNDCYITLSNKPNINFINKDTHELIRVTLDKLMDKYITYKKEVNTEKNRSKKAENNARRFSSLNK